MGKKDLMKEGAFHNFLTLPLSSSNMLEEAIKLFRGVDVSDVEQGASVGVKLLLSVVCN